MSYKRVIPRDFFNESKLLKCLGKLELLICFGPNPLGLKSNLESETFNIEQDPADGSIYVSNYKVELDGEPIHLCHPLNCKSEWPLLAIYKDEIYHVFNERGELMPNFGKKE